MCCSFDKLKNKWSYYRGRNCVEMFCKDSMKIINYEKKEMIPLTNEQIETYEKKKVFHICKKKFSTDKKIVKPEIFVITPENSKELLILIAV